MTLAIKPVRRESAVTYRGRPLVVEMHPGFISIREKGRRTAVSVDLRSIYDLGWKIMARAAAAEKAAARKQRRKR